MVHQPMYQPTMGMSSEKWKYFFLNLENIWDNICALHWLPTNKIKPSQVSGVKLFVTWDEGLCLVTDNSCFRWNTFVYWSQWTQTEREANLHQVSLDWEVWPEPSLTWCSTLQIPNIGVREGVPHQPLPHQAETDRDGSPALSHRETN